MNTRSANLTQGPSRIAKLSILLALYTAGVGQSFVFTSLPPIGREIGLSEAQIGLIIAFGAAVFVVFSHLWGKWVARVGIRRSVQIGLVTFGITTAILGFVLELALIGKVSAQFALYAAMAMRGLFAIGSAGVGPAVQSFFVFNSTPENRTSAISNMSVAVAAGMITGPALAALLSTISLTIPFYFTGLACAVVVIMLQLYLPKTKVKKAKAKPLKMVWRGHPAVPLMALSVLAVFCTAGLQQIALFYVQDTMALSAVEAAQKGGIAMTIMSANSILVQLAVVKRVSWNPAKMIYLGSILYVASALCLLFMANYVGIIIGLSLFGMGTGFLFPAITSKQTLVSQPHEQGPVAGTNASAQGLGVTMGPIACAALYGVGMSLPFILIGVVAAAIGLFYAYVRTKISNA